jgi:hypothetical protein
VSSIHRALSGAKRTPKGMMPKAPKLDIKTPALKRVFNSTLPAAGGKRKQPY